VKGDTRAHDRLSVSVSLRRPRGRASTWEEEVSAMQTTKDEGFLFCGIVSMTLTRVWGVWELKS